AVLDQFVSSSTEIRGLFGGVILRGEGRTVPATGRIAMLHSREPIPPLSASADSLLSGSFFSSAKEIASGNHVAAMLLWSVVGFSQFAFDLLAMIRGIYDPGRVSSFYAFGQDG